MPGITPETEVQVLKGVGDRRAKALAEVGIHRVCDLLLHLPYRYEDRTMAKTPPQAAGGRRAVEVVVRSVSVRPTRRRNLKLVELRGDADEGPVRALWFNQVHLRRALQPGRRVLLFGDTPPGGALDFQNPAWELVDSRDRPDDAPTDGDDSPHAGRVVPVYERVGAVSPRRFRELIHRLLHDDEKAGKAVGTGHLPEEAAARLGLPSRKEALVAVHLPPADATLSEWETRRSPGHRRLILEEFFAFAAGLRLRRRGDRNERPQARRFAANDEIRETARRALPFRLTGSQREALRTIAEDFREKQPMRRLLQGDVGSGKTIVAVIAALIVMGNRAQTALMAPTELLAEQHFGTIRRLLEPHGVLVSLLTSGLSKRDREATLRAVAEGRSQFVVGTHALIQEGARFHDLGFAIVDEQHRFGVVQRRDLLARNGEGVDLLVMTATPIPRTLTLALYGDLAVSELRDMPPGRQPIQTLLRGRGDRPEVEDLVRAAAREGRQAYYVCPFIEDSEVLPGSAVEVRFRELVDGPFRNLRVGLVHGRVSAPERQATMERFAAGRLDVLVATTVIEVGVDVPNATVMVIEGAERFGLAQLHQLRGRVGRGSAPSTAVLLTESSELGEAALRRLKVMQETTDGFRIAEEDLAIRGPGDVMGFRQSGLPPFRVADLVRDADLLREAHEEARRFLASGDVKRPEGKRILEYVRSTWGGRFGLTAAG